jgi:hypothetical protein
MTVAISTRSGVAAARLAIDGERLEARLDGRRLDLIRSVYGVGFKLEMTDRGGLGLADSVGL